MAKNIKLKQLADAVMDQTDYCGAILLAEPAGTNMASTFLRYRDTNFLSALNQNEMDSERIRLAILGGLRFGKPVVIDAEDCDLFSAIEKFVDNVRPGLFCEIVSNTINYDRYSPNFRFIVYMRKEPPAEWAAKFK